MEIPNALLAAFPPSADLLLDCVRRQTDDAMLMDIALADYGQEAEEAMAGLRPIRDTGVISPPLPWIVSEVLLLTHYCDPETPAPPPFRPGPTGVRGHMTRLFACAVILRVEADLSPDYRRVEDSALARCLVSANVLGEELSTATASFLVWWLSRVEPDPESLLFALGLLILALRLRSGRLTEVDLGAIARWVLEVDSLGNAKLAESMPGFTGPWPPPFSVHVGFWQPLIAEFEAEVESIRDAEVRTGLQVCGLLLNPDPY